MECEPSAHGVELVEWPAGARRREHLALAGIPRLLIVDHDAPPPARLAPDEGWIREPYTADDLAARVKEVAAASRREQAEAWLDGDHVLHVGGRCTALSPTEAVATGVLLAAAGTLVSKEALLAALAADGHHRDPGAVDVLVSRLRRRLVPVGLRVRCVRGRGYSLDP